MINKTHELIRSTKWPSINKICRLFQVQRVITIKQTHNTTEPQISINIITKSGNNNNLGGWLVDGWYTVHYLMCVMMESGYHIIIIIARVYLPWINCWTIYTLHCSATVLAKK